MTTKKKRRQYRRREKFGLTDLRVLLDLIVTAENVILGLLSIIISTITIVKMLK